MIQEAILKLCESENLTYEEAAGCIDEIMGGNTSQAQTAAFLMGLAAKGETVEEIAACAESMRSHAVRFHHEGDVLEIVGTGGDRSNSFNISTTSAIVTAAGGVKTAKHGNRAASSKCGAADVLEALGVNITLEPERMEKVFEEAGIAFMHAQVYHKSMKYVAPVRKELGCHTVFNILGPLTNPAFNTMQLMGVYTEKLVVPMAEVLIKLGVKDGMVVFGTDVMDEISMSAPTSVCEFHDSSYECYQISPEDFGMERCTKADLAGGDPEENKQITLDILNGKEQGHKRNAVLLNAGAVLYIAKKADTFAGGVKLAGEIIDSGAAMKKLEQFVKLTN